MRAQIIVWYLGVLGALLLALCVFQTVTLSRYFQSTKAMSMQQAAEAEFSSVGPCFVRSPSELSRNARSLSLVLGPQGVEATIVTPAGRILASHAFDQYGGSAHVSPLPAGVVRRLIPRPASGPETGGFSACRGHASSGHGFTLRSVRSGDTLYIDMPLGPEGHPAGYAILGRSMAAEDATMQHARLTLWSGALAVLIITAIVALPIMNRALRPLTRVTSTAEAIAAGALGNRANLTPSVDEVGRLGRAFDTMVDRLQEALGSATASEERMRRFLADASHELRTPLTVLCGASQLLLRQWEMEPLEIDEAILAINQESTRLSQLVDDLLRLSRLDAGQELDPHPVTVSLFLERFVERYAAAWPERSIEVDRSSLDGTQAHVDPEALTRVLTNLVDNAARYSAAGKPIVLTGEAAEETVSIMVSDQGPGLSAEDAGRVFERFYRGSKSRSRSSGGSGLGLAIVHALVRQSRGEIRIETGPNRGTTVAVTLPRPGAA